MPSTSNELDTHSDMSSKPAVHSREERNCMNEPFTMTVSAAVSAVRSFSPRIVYPYHFRNQNGTFADLNSFKQQVSANPGTEVRIRTWY